MDLITGANGFIGRHLLTSLLRDDVACRALARHPLSGVSTVQADLLDRKGLAEACIGIDRIFHCAGYAHAFSSRFADDATRHWQVNFEGTRNLLEAAGQAGVKRFVFLSSVKAMAEPGEACIDEDFPGQPETAYGQSKRAAEQAVLAAGQAYGMHVVNLRLAMVYGAGGRGNLERMGNLVGRGLFPPLPETGNRRSLVHVDDVVSAMRLVAGSAAANGRPYIVAASEAPSGRALFDALRAAHGLSPCTWSVPASILDLAARFGDAAGKILGRRVPLDSEVVARLLGSACYSAGRIERELGWHARISLAEGLSGMIRK
ncbi:MAG: NAD-dependent epimerase/dehydratase family protein [Azonexus sp.]